jgi:hypothetical protein
MIQPEEKSKLEELKARMNCPRQFFCIGASLDKLCEAEHHAELNILECLELRPIACKFAKPVAHTFACTCPLRIYISEHFDQWSAESTALLRHGPDRK